MLHFAAVDVSTAEVGEEGWGFDKLLEGRLVCFLCQSIRSYVSAGVIAFSEYMTRIRSRANKTTEFLIQPIKMLLSTLRLGYS